MLFSARIMRWALSRTALGAFTLAVFSIIGALWSIVLTLLHQQGPTACRVFWPGLRGDGCATVLADPWAMIRDVPVTLYSGSLFVSSLVVAGIILLTPRRAASYGPVVLIQGSIAAVAAVDFLLRAHLVLGIWCELCGVLQVVCLGHFLGALVLAGPGVRRRWDQSTVVIAAAAVVVFATASAIQEDWLQRPRTAGPELVAHEGSSR